MGFFDDCELDQRYSSHFKSYRWGGMQWTVHDWDQRRTITVCTSWKENDEDFIFEALDELEEDLPADAVSIDIADNGRLLSSSSDLDSDRTMIPFYPSVADFPPGLRMVRRSDLTEMDRMGLQVDLATYGSVPGQIKQVAFKYYMAENNVPIFWHEINCTLRIPQHPNIVPFDSLVIDTIDGNDLVVVDYINLRLGIVHGDICPWNLLVNSETDNLQIFDFNLAAKLGSEGDEKYRNVFKYDAARNDVKLVVFTLYEIITRDQHFREHHYPIKWDISAVLTKHTWEQHSEVRLDSPISDYRRVLEEWVTIRQKVDEDITHHTQTPEAIDWPPLPEFPLVPFAGAMSREQGQLRKLLIKRGAGFLRWQRSGSWELPLPAGQRLLATGEIVHE